MRWPDTALPVDMQRLAFVAPTGRIRSMLVGLAGSATVELEVTGAGAGRGEAARRLVGVRSAGTRAALAAQQPDLDLLRSNDRVDLLLGEAELEERASAAVHGDGVAALAGWAPSAAVTGLRQRLAPVGAAVVPLPPPRSSEPPTLLSGGRLATSLSPVVSNYGPVAYRDLDPVLPFGIAYVVMFGMMFADAGHGLLLLAAALVLRSGRWRGLRRWQGLWRLIAAAGVAAAGFGALYGEFFGPTRAIPVLWLDPTKRPMPVMVAGLVAGAALLALAYLFGTVNRLREAGWGRALHAGNGGAGAALFAGLCLALLGFWAHRQPLVVVGAMLAAAGVVLFAAGVLGELPRRPSSVVQAGVELFDAVLRTGSNLVSFIRLAAFGLTHAVLGLLVWQATTALWQHTGGYRALAVVAFLLGTSVCVALEGLIAGIQALRLEYYELFSRVFDAPGRSFRPWHPPVVSEGFPCLPG